MKLFVGDLWESLGVEDKVIPPCRKMILYIEQKARCKRLLTALRNI